MLLQKLDNLARYAVVPMQRLDHTCFGFGSEVAAEKLNCTVGSQSVHFRPIPAMSSALPPWWKADTRFIDDILHGMLR